MSQALQKLDQLLQAVSSPSTLLMSSNLSSNPNVDESKSSTVDNNNITSIPPNDPSLQLPPHNQMQYISISTSSTSPNPILSLTTIPDDSKQDNSTSNPSDQNSLIPTNLSAREVLIKVLATAVNRADLLQAAGKYPPPPGVTPILGLECCGIIISKSDSCTRGNITNIGTYIMALVPGGSYAQYCKCDERCLIPLPSNIPPSIGAAIPEAFLTAFQILFKYGEISLTNIELNKNKIVLIHAAASGVGTILLQYCKLFGLISFVTCGSDEKIRICVDKYGASGGWNYKLKHDATGRKFDNFSEALLEIYPNGADVILDCVGQNYWNGNMDCVAIDGKWVIYGFLSGVNVKCDNGYFNIAKILRKRVKIIGTTLRSRSNEYKGELVDMFGKYIVPLLREGKISPVVDKQFEMKNANEAHEYVRQNKNVGKVVLCWE